MLTYHTELYQQAFVVLDSASTSGSLSAPLVSKDSAGAGSYAGLVNSGSAPASTASQPYTQTLVLGTPFSSMSVVHRAELSREYQELGQALSEMTELEEGDAWKIETPVYAAACFVAAGLMSYSLPAPRIVNHGPKSVVFNWSHEADSLYLTVSADRMSALISSPQRIKRRVEYSLKDLSNPALALSSVRPAYLGEPVKFLVTGSVATEPIG
jgi:hypothetical protein